MEPRRRKIRPPPIPPHIRIRAVCPKCGQSFGSQYGWVTCPECKTEFAHFREEQEERQPAARPSPLWPEGLAVAGLAVLLLFLLAGFWATVSLFGPLLLILLVVGLFVFWFRMLADCLKNPRMQGTDKIVWVLVIIFLNWIGALVYYFVGRTKQA